MARLELADFLGKWIDSLGNNVEVWKDARGTQVKLSKPNKKGKEILLDIKQLKDGNFECGHYNLDTSRSRQGHIAWGDKRYPDRTTVWTSGRPTEERREERRDDRRDDDRRADRRERHDRQEERQERPRKELPMPGSSPRKAGEEASSREQQPQRPAVASPFDLDTLLNTSSFNASAVGPPPVWPPPARPPPSTLPQVGSPQGTAYPNPAGWNLPPATSPGAWVPPGTAQLSPTAAALLAPPAAPPIPQHPPSWQQATPASTSWQQGAGAAASSSSAASASLPAATGEADWSAVLNLLTATAAGATQPAVQPAAATVQAPATANAAQEGWGQMLNLLAAAQAPANANAAQADAQKGGGAAPPPSPLEPHVVLPRQLTAAPHTGQIAARLRGSPVVVPPPPPPPPPPPAGQITELFSAFGMPQQEKPVESTEEERGQVLEEILARLRMATGGGASQTALNSAPWRKSAASTAASPGADGSQAAPSPGYTVYDAEDQYGDEADVPDWQRKKPSPEAYVEEPLDKFMRVFGLDQLARKCLGALEDDEAAFVIENVQGRLATAKNPSAVVMTAIKGVAARVGRRYYGNRGASDLETLLAAAGMGSGTGRKPAAELTFFEGEEEPSPEAEPEVEAVAEDPYAAAAVDPYGVAVECEEEEEYEEEEPVVDEVVDPEQVESSGGQLAAEAGAVGLEPEAKRRRVDDNGLETVELDDGAIAEGVDPEEEEAEDDDAEGEDDGLFFVDTGGV